MTEHQHQQQRRALRAHTESDDAGRQLQGNNKDKNKKQNTPAPTFSPTMSPTHKPTQDDSIKGSLSLEWSMLEDTTSGLSGVEDIKIWIAQDFLCLQDNIWLTSDLTTLDSDCQSTIRRLQAEEEEEGDDDDDDVGEQNSEQPLYPDRTILLNDPVVLESRETLWNSPTTEYTVWTLQYPVHSFADQSDEKTIQEELQNELNQEIELETIVWDDGMLAVVGNETKVFAPPTGHYWRYNDNFTYVELGPISLTWLQSLGAVIAVAQTLGLILLHEIVKPYMKERNHKKKKKEQQEKELKFPPGSIHSHHNDESSLVKGQRDYIPINISIPDPRAPRHSGSSSAYPIPY